MTKKIKILSTISLPLILLAMLLSPVRSSAVCPPQSPPPTTLQACDCASGQLAADNANLCARTSADCLSGQVLMIGGKPSSKCELLGNSPGALKDNPIVGDLNTIVNVLAGLVGVVVVGSIILGGVQFTAAGDKAERVTAAKQRIINGLIALVAFLFIYSFLQWLIPGGVFQ